MCRHFGLREAGDVGVGLITGAVGHIERCTLLIVVVLGIRDRCVADVVGQVLSYVHIIGVVNDLISFSFGVGTRINNLQLAQTALNGPAEVVERVFDHVGA